MALRLLLQNLQGPRGSPGPAGMRGPTGPTGPTYTPPSATGEAVAPPDSVTTGAQAQSVTGPVMFADSLRVDGSPASQAVFQLGGDESTGCCTQLSSKIISATAFFNTLHELISAQVPANTARFLAIADVSISDDLYGTSVFRLTVGYDGTSLPSPPNVETVFDAYAEAGLSSPYTSFGCLYEPPSLLFTLAGPSLVSSVQTAMATTLTLYCVA